MYKNIVVAYDDSECSKAALTQSSQWIKKHGGKAILVHAVFFDEEEFVIDPEQRDRRFEAGKTMCFVAKKTASSEFGLNGDLESLVCEGEPPDVIVEIAQARKADLIAMGTHGRKGLKRLFMGSVTSRVIVTSHCDVLVVKRACEKCSGEYTSILLPFDGSDTSRKALSRACEMAKTDGAELSVLYVIPRYEEMIEFFKTQSIDKSLWKEAERIVAIAREMASAYRLTIQTEIGEGSASERIVGTVHQRNHDLIVMGTYGWKGVNRALLGSTTERVIMDAPCPVLAVR